MGYRSNVMALVYAGNDKNEEGGMSMSDEYAKLKTLMNTTYKDLLDEWGADFQWLDERHVLKFTCDDVKWYPSYPAVVAFSKYLQEIEELGFATEYVRIGEETDDIDEQYSERAEYYLSVSRVINCEV